MTALARSSAFSTPLTAAETDLSSSVSPSIASDMMAGDAVEMFTCSILSSGSKTAEGDQIQSFTCSI